MIRGWGEFISIEDAGFCPMIKGYLRALGREKGKVPEQGVLRVSGKEEVLKRVFHC